MTAAMMHGGPAAPAILKYRDVLVETRAPRVMIGGLVKLRKGKTIGGVVDVSTGRVIRGTGMEVVTGESGWSHNIVTNNGLNKLADNLMSAVTTYCHCGTGTTSEVATDTALETFVAATNSIESTDSAVEASAPYFASYTRTFRFAEGVAEGNISEVGFSDQATTGDLFSRARVKDGGGTPTTISVAADEWLDVTYEFRLYPDHILSGGGADDGSGTISISATSTSYTIRPSFITNSLFWVASTTRAQFKSVSSIWAKFFDSASTLGAATSEPTNNSGADADATHSAISAATYSTDTYNRDISLQVGLSDGNASGGVGAIRFNTGMGTYQMDFDPVVAKDATKVWTFVVNLAWTRATIP